MPEFQLKSNMKPQGDQPAAIDALVDHLQGGAKSSTLLGVTGSGKTFSLANVIERIQKPALIISHNKTLAAQLYAEFAEFFPDNAVHYFVSYYDYYQPEAYIPQRDIYIEKDAGINEDIDRLRLAATSALLSRNDVIIVASVSCIYGLGSPEDYKRMIIPLKRGDEIPRARFLRSLVDQQYERTDIDLVRGKFRVRGDVIELIPSYQETGLRVEFFGDEVERIAEIHPISGEVITEFDEFTVYPAKHFVMPEEKLKSATDLIEDELVEQLNKLRSEAKLLEAQRLEARTRYDLEMLNEIGYCKGIENYSRHLSGRPAGERPATLIDYFPDDFVCMVDESHVTVPQVRGMYNGDRARKQTLVDHGFRLPSAMDNRPMRFPEWEKTVPQVVYVSATPGPYELSVSDDRIVEQIIRPTGLVDPPIEVRPADGQVPDLMKEIKIRVDKKERVLVTTLTKRLAEDLSNFIADTGIRVTWLHSEIDAIERVRILQSLRKGEVDVLVGVNLLREGLDLPEVTLVAILDADKEGFLRSATSIIQTVGRTARNIAGQVILYADRVTDSMQQAIDETSRRREIQLAYNEEHNIEPRTIQKAIKKGIEDIIEARKKVRDLVHMDKDEEELLELIKELEAEMLQAADSLEFERAAEIRDMIMNMTGGAKTNKRSRKKGLRQFKIGSKK